MQQADPHRKRRTTTGSGSEAPARHNATICQRRRYPIPTKAEERRQYLPTEATASGDHFQPQRGSNPEHPAALPAAAKLRRADEIRPAEPPAAQSRRSSPPAYLPRTAANTEAPAKRSAPAARQTCRGNQPEEPATRSAPRTRSHQDGGEICRGNTRSPTRSGQHQRRRYSCHNSPTATARRASTAARAISAEQPAAGAAAGNLPRTAAEFWQNDIKLQTVIKSPICPIYRALRLIHQYNYRNNK